MSGVAVTSATTQIYGETIWDPVEVLARFRDPWVHALAMVALGLATLATNIAANVVGPANDIDDRTPEELSRDRPGTVSVPPLRIHRDVRNPPDGRGRSRAF